MKKLVFIFIWLAANARAEVRSGCSFTVNTTGVTCNYEQSLGEKFTVTGRAGLWSPYMGWSSSSGFGFSINPGAGVEPRYYYNLKQRAARNRNTNHNAGNYWAVDGTYLFKPAVSRGAVKQSGVLNAPNWGLR
ncbi:MAG: hypothetical protein LBH06_01785 [Rikenellaceae bacterium]|jgi:hypothetical protein|nr:hypothetical protein [Rikenellaceae bacterium]